MKDIMNQVINLLNLIEKYFGERPMACATLKTAKEETKCPKFEDSLTP